MNTISNKILLEIVKHTSSKTHVSLYRVSNKFYKLVNKVYISKLLNESAFLTFNRNLKVNPNTKNVSNSRKSLKISKTLKPIEPVKIIKLSDLFVKNPKIKKRGYIVCTVCNEDTNEIYECYVCQSIVCFECMSVCSECCNNTCEPCFNYSDKLCEECIESKITDKSESSSNKTYCYGCAVLVDIHENECGICDAPYCTECIEYCKNCRVNICDECNTENPIVKKLCKKCRECVKCNKITKYKCSACNAQLCHVCRHKCNDCDNRFCDACVRDQKMHVH